MMQSVLIYDAIESAQKYETHSEDYATHCNASFNNLVAIVQQFQQRRTISFVLLFLGNVSTVTTISTREITPMAVINSYHVQSQLPKFLYMGEDLLYLNIHEAFQYYS